MMGERLTQRVEREMRDRAARGEPEPGTYVCGRCLRTDGVQMFTVLMGPRETIEATGELNRLDKYGPSWTTNMKGVLICPCCSHKGCPHPPKLTCPRCGRPTDDGWATKCLGHPDPAIASWVGSRGVA